MSILYDFNNDFYGKKSIYLSIQSNFQHKFLLNQDLVDQLWYLIQPTIIHNLCAELCLAFPPNQTTPNPIFPDGYGYEDCMVAADVVYHGGIKLLSRTLIPNKFCSKPLLNVNF
jgi:hypothetical protein